MSTPGLALCRVWRAVAVLAWPVAWILSATPVDVLTYHYDLARTGRNTNETTLTPANVGVNTFGKLATFGVDGQVYAQPLVVTGVNIPGQGVHDVVYVATQHNTVFAFDANGGGLGSLWEANLGPSAPTPNQTFGHRYGPFESIVPEVGITGTPVIDPVAGVLYVDALTSETTGNYNHYIHALNIATGQECQGSPVRVAGSVPGVGVGSVNGALAFDPNQHLQRAALTLAGGNLYVAYSSYGDTDPFHGWIVGLSTKPLGINPQLLFCDTPNATVEQWGANAGEGGIWMSGNGLAADAQGSLYVMTGNGSFNANLAGGAEYGDCVLRLSANGVLAVMDYFAPFNQALLAANDIDLGSGGLMLLPDEAGTTAHPHLLVGAGKEGRLYLLDRDRLGGYDPNGDSGSLQTLPGALGGVFSSPAYFNGLVYYQATGDVLKAFRVTSGQLSATPETSSRTPFGFPGATPVISANGVSGAIAWVVETDGYPGANAILRAYDATNLAVELYNSSQALDRDVPGFASKFTTPVVANGKVYVATKAAVSIYGLVPFLAAPTIAPNGGLFTNAATVTITAPQPQAAVYYTLDGTAPTINSTAYSGPFLVTNSTTVIAAAFLAGFLPSPAVEAQYLNGANFVEAAGFLKHEVFSSVTRPQVETPGAAGLPTATDYLTSFEPPPSFGTDYSDRVSGWFVPAQTGKYVFFLCAADDADLFLSTDDTAENLRLIASETLWSKSREWVSSTGGSDLPSKRSDEFPGTQWPTGNVISLIAGRRYFIQGVRFHSVGVDDFAVTCKMSSDPDPELGDAPLITASGIAVDASRGAVIDITAQPVDALVVQGHAVSFSVNATVESVSPTFPASGFPLEFQWQSAPRVGAAFSALPGAIGPVLAIPSVALGDQGRLYRAVLAAPGVSVTSAVARLAVVADVTPPTPVSVVDVDPTGTSIAIRFSKPLNPYSVAAGTNYHWSPAGVIANGGVLDSTGAVLTVTTATPLSPGVSYILSFSGLRDNVGNPLPAGASISFSFQPGSYHQTVLGDGPLALFGFQDAAGSESADNSVAGAQAGAYYIGDEETPGAGGRPAGARPDSGPRPPQFAGFDSDNLAAAFDGAGFWVDTRVSYLGGPAAFTLECWANTSNRISWNGRVCLVGQYEGPAVGFATPYLLQLWTPNGGQLILGDSFPDGEWVHVAAVGDGASLSLYYNGVLQGSAPEATTNYGGSSFTTRIGGGGIFDPTGNYFTGCLDEVAIFNKALSADQVAGHYRAAVYGANVIEPGYVLPPTLRFTAIDTAFGWLAIQWQGQGALQEAASPNGPWTDSLNQEDYQVIPVEGARFYRLRH